VRDKLSKDHPCLHTWLALDLSATGRQHAGLSKGELNTVFLLFEI